MTETKRLGRGLEALLGPISRERAEAAGTLREVAVDSVRPNPFQPRTTIDEAALTELAASIEASGLLQPVVLYWCGQQFMLGYARRGSYQRGDREPEQQRCVRCRAVVGIRGEWRIFRQLY